MLTFSCVVDIAMPMTRPPPWCILEPTYRLILQCHRLQMGQQRIVGSEKIRPVERLP
jgi:hypothetical protein